MVYSKNFVRLNWIALVAIYLVIIAGSFVRISGSGMGCPDWPKCFGKWIPPTEVSELPEGYQKEYLEKRKAKLDKFCKVLVAFGMNETADKLQNDPYVLTEQDFNVSNTWTEYINRLFGFLAGNLMLAAFLWILLKYRKRRIVLISLVNLILMGFQAWFGSIVVASNLVPWTITVHMFLALVIIFLQIYLIYLISPTQQKSIEVKPWIKYMLWFICIITVYQMFLGTQVREEIDMLTKKGFSREHWIEMIGLPFFIHRSFSWMVLVLLSIVAFINEKKQKLSLIRWTYALLILELVSGVLLAYAEMPGLIQTAHLVFASAILGILMMFMFRGRSVTVVSY